MAERKQYEVVVTPPGIAAYPKLFEPDRKYKAEGEYSVKVLFDKDDPAWAAFIAKAKQTEEEGYQEALKEKKKKVLKRASSWLKEEMDPDTGEATGKRYIISRMKASGVSKKTNKPWAMRPVILDAKKNVLSEDPKLGSGSTIRLKVELAPYFTDALGYGLRFPMRAVQIVNLVKWQKDEGSGFDAEDGGFDSSGGDALDKVPAGGSSDPDDDGI